MTKRWIISGVLAAALLTATVGIAYAVGNADVSPPEPGTIGLLAACEAMHDTPAMQAMHEHMPTVLQASCDAMHEQMDQMMGTAGMMGSFGMMGSPGMGTASVSGMSGGSMADHHPSTEG